MNLQDLKDKYNKAHEAYLKYKDTNKTNNTEQQYMPEIMLFLKEIKPNSTFIINSDNFLNFLGVDIIEQTSSGTVFTYDVKVCQYQEDFNILCDGWKRNGNEYYKATDIKINDYYLFLNKSYYIIIPTKYIDANIPSMEKCFYMRRDLYKTTSKFILDTNYIRKYYKERKKNDK